MLNYLAYNAAKLNNQNSKPSKVVLKYYYGRQNNDQSDVFLILHIIIPNLNRCKCESYTGASCDDFQIVDVGERS